jgi:AcrR family transcriptional regulator
LSRAESRERTRELLLDAAAEVFARLGYHDGSLETVAEAAGFSKGAVYSNFATKSDLFLALLDRQARRRIDEQAGAMAALSLEQIADYGGRALTDMATAQRSFDLLQIEFWLAAARDPEIGAKFAEGSRALWQEAGALFDRKFAEEGHAPPFSGQEFAILVNALGTGLLMQLYLDPGAVDATLFSRALRALLGNAAVSESGGTPGPPSRSPGPATAR